MSHPDPRYKKGAVTPEMLKVMAERKKQENKWHWSLTFAIIGSIIGGIITGVVISFTMLSFIYALLAAVAIALIAFLVQWKKFYSQKFIEKHFRINKAAYAMYNFAIGICVTGILLLANWLGAGGELIMEEHRIVGIDKNYIHDSCCESVLLLENNAYEREVNMRSMPWALARKWRNKPIYHIITKKGLLGIPVFYGKEMVADPSGKPAE